MIPIGAPACTTRGPITGESGDVGVDAARAGMIAAAARSARALERETQALACTHLALDRELALGLARMWDQQLFRPLGYVRATDYVREQLGLKEGKARQLAKLGRALRAVPELDGAWTAGRVNASHVAELLRVVGAQSSVDERRAWVERAAGCTVRALRLAVRAELDRRRRGEGNHDDAAGRQAAGAVGAGEKATGGAAGPHIVSASRLEAQLRPGVNLLDPDAAEDGDWFSLPVPARVSELWAVAVGLARKAAGQNAPLQQCAEWIAADYLARVGDEHPADTARREQEFRRQRGGAALGRLMDRTPRRQSLFDLIAASGLDSSILPAPGAGSRPHPPATAERAARQATPMPVARVALDPAERTDSAADSWQLSAVLCRLIARKRRLRLELGQRLDHLERTRAWEHLGCASYDDYCDEQLGFGRRQAESLSHFYRLVRRYRRLRRAYLEGTLSYTATRTLLRVVHRSTEQLWIEWARGLSARDIDRTVEHAALYMLPGADPAVLRSSAQRLAAETTNAFAAGGARPALPCGPKLATNACAVPDPAAAPPLGWPLPPVSRRHHARIRGLDHAIAALPERLVAGIRFWAPADVLFLLRRALRRCRDLLPPPAPADTRPDWSFLEVVLVQFILEHDAPATRRGHRLHRILDRDQFCCAIPGCTSRARLEVHHLWLRSQQGPHAAWNLITVCKAHHALIHEGVIEIGGWAPWALSVRLGIHPESGQALVCTKHGRRVPEHEARAELARWRAWCRSRRHKTT